MKPCNAGPDRFAPSPRSAGWCAVTALDTRLAERFALVPGYSATVEGPPCACNAADGPCPLGPWQVQHATPGSNGGLHVQGFNHYTGESFAWGINHYGLVGSYRSGFGRFRGATFAPGARKRLAVLLRLARRDGQRP